MQNKNTTTDYSNTLFKSKFKISKMDCPCEENLIRMKLEPFTEIKGLEFDISNRELVIFHVGKVGEIETSILELNLQGKRIHTEPAGKFLGSRRDDEDQKQLLKTVLAINFIFFLIEVSTGFFAKSMGLVADSLDMLADAFVYGISLLAVARSMLKKKAIAKFAGYAQIILALLGFIEVLRRFFGIEKFPDFSTMIVVSFFALVANGICLYLMQKSKSKDEAHMKASLIFTSNDVIINLGVIMAAIFVKLLNSGKPDLIIGIVVFIVVIQGAFRILKAAG